VKLPRLSQIEPSKIRAQIRSAGSLTDENVCLSPILLKVLIDKLRHGEALETFELEILVSQSDGDTLGPIERTLLRQYILRLNSQDALKRVFELSTDCLGPSLFYANNFFNEIVEKIGLTSSEEVAPFLSFFGTASPEVELLKTPPEPAISFLMCLNRYGRNAVFSSGQHRLSRRIVTDKIHHDLFVSHFDLLVLFLDRTYVSTWSEIWIQIDNAVGAALQKFERGWYGEFFDEQLGFQKVLALVKQQGQNSSSLPNISTLLQKIRDLDKSLDALSAEVADRGEYWKSHLKHCSKIEGQKKSTGPYRVAVAFHIGSAVLVEFGPQGNALYVYTREVFSEIRGNDSWKNTHKTVKFLSPYTTADGTAIHNDGWQNRFDSLVKRLLRDPSK
jgi:hypothetical protein